MDKKEFKLLVKKYLNGKATDEEKRFVEAYYEEQNSGLSITDIMGDEEIGLTAHEMMDNIQSRISKQPNAPIIRRINWQKYAAVAAMLAVIVSVSMFLYVKHNADLASLAYRTYYTKVANLSKIALSDGTVVWLNADSKFRCPQSFEGAATREVYLEGEAYFEVAKDKKHPFLVHSGNLTTRVLGTKFDVNAYRTNKTIEVTLLEGKVMLTARSEIDHHKKTDTLYLKPNEKAFFNQSTAMVKTALNVQTEMNTDNKDTGKSLMKDASGEIHKQALLKVPVENAALAASWKDGRLMFNNEPLENVIAALSRKYNVSISAKENLLNSPVSLTVGNEPLEDILLTVTKQLKYRDIKGNTQYNREGQFKKSGSKYFIE